MSNQKTRTRKKNVIKSDNMPVIGLNNDDDEIRKDTLNEFFDSNPDESEKYQILRGFYTDENIEQKTDLKTREIDAIVKTELLEDILKDEFGLFIDLRGFTKQYKTHLVSRDRKGRTEAMEVLKGDAEKEKSFIQKMLGEKS